MRQWFFGKGPAYPFTRTDGGNFGLAEGKALAFMGLEQTILTGLGKRVMLKNIGSKFNRLLFSLEEAQRDALAKEYCIQAVQLSEPRIIIDDVIVDNGEEGNEIYMKIDYRFIGDNVKQNKVIKIPAMGV